MAVTVESVGITAGNLGYLAPTALTYINNQQWWLQPSPVSLGTTLPSIFPKYRFTAMKRDGSGTNVQERTITGYVENFVTVTSPAYSGSDLAPTDVTAAPTFSWTWPGATAPSWYGIYVQDRNITTGDNQVWSQFDIPPSQTSVPYTGPLVNGHIYQYTINAGDNGGNSSQRQGYFRYTGATSTISFNGGVKTLPNWPSTDGAAAISGPPSMR